MALPTLIPISEALGDLLLGARNALDVTQGEISRLSGVSTFSIGRWERGVGHYIRSSQIRKLTKVLELSDSQVMTASGGKSTALVPVAKPGKVDRKTRTIGKRTESSYCVTQEVTVRVVTTLVAADPRSAGMRAKRELIARLTQDGADEMVTGFDLKKIEIRDGSSGGIVV